MISQASAGRRLRLVAIGTAAIAVVVAGGCGEKSEPAIHAPTTTVAPTTTTPTTSTPSSVTTKPTPTPTAPVPKTTP